MISDDDLLLYYYRDGLDAAERARIGAALSEQPDLARRMQVLVARLDAAAAQPEVPVPDLVQQRWLTALANASGKDDAGETHVAKTGGSWSRDARWMAVAATLAIVALAAVIRVSTQSPPAQIAEVVPPASPAAEDPEIATGYERSLKWHLASTERSLAGLEDANPQERARLVETIIAQNRIYALAAERAGEPQLARVLRAFGPILEGLGQEGGESSASSVARLSFELRVMQGRLGADTAASTPSTTL